MVSNTRWVTSMIYTTQMRPQIQVTVSNICCAELQRAI